MKTYLGKLRGMFPHLCPTGHERTTHRNLGSDEPIRQKCAQCRSLMECGYDCPHVRDAYGEKWVCCDCYPTFPTHTTPQLHIPDPAWDDLRQAHTRNTY